MQRMMMPVILAVAVLTMAAAGGHAAPPSFDCEKAKSSAEKLICKDGQLAALDRELARLFPLARDGGSAAPARRKELVASQRGWIKGRDDCWKAPALRACVLENYARRIHELRQDSMDARSRDARGVSLGPFMLTCPGFGALIGATFINVEPSLAYLEWKDRSLVMTIARSASGARYTASTQEGEAQLWTKGNEALFTLPGEPERTCGIEKAGR